jgi:hypothetical protein
MGEFFQGRGAFFMSIARTGATQVAQPSSVETRLRRLTDPEVSSIVDAKQQSLRDPAEAMRYLKDKGFLTPSGRVPKKYGG